MVETAATVFGTANHNWQSDSRLKAPCHGNQIRSKIAPEFSTFSTAKKTATLL